MLKERIGLIGAGRMATALARGMIGAGLVSAENLSAADSSVEARERFTATTGVRAVEDNLAVAAESDVLVLAVKPQIIAAVTAQLRETMHEGILVISIAAGVRLETLADELGADVRLVRVMPNTPCLVGQGASAFALGPGATDADRELVLQLLESMGLAVEVEEPLLDAVTGLSGSGPAFVYLLIEAMAEGGARMGLSADVATRLACQTVRGAAEMVQATGEHPAVLADHVTSPGGTTAAGLAVLRSAKYQEAIRAAVEAATRRSIELASRKA